jgi:LPXTG-motif cell wall-anchored protein
MKKLLAIIMVLIQILSLSFTAFAEENTGSITITNATSGQTYSVYKIFGATVSMNAAGGADAVSYTITKDNQFFEALFGKDGTTPNPFFVYNADFGSVLKNESANDTALITYLTALVQSGSFTPAATPVTATDKQIVFDNLPYGYYLISSSLGSAVTINSTAPDAVVIDKNQMPFTGGLQKEIYDKDDDVWTDHNHAYVGEIVKYRVTFNTTNYAGMEQIRYYTLTDTKGDALWVEFGDSADHTYDIAITIGDKTLTKGYYHLVNQEIKTEVQEWEFLGDWTAEEKAAQNANHNVAQWYLIHYGYDKFEIVIPWLNNYVFVGTDSDFDLLFLGEGSSPYDSAAAVEIVYYASVEPNASVGDTKNLTNEAIATWRSANNSGNSNNASVYTQVGGFGIHKIDSATGVALAGAEFELYNDAEGKDPLYVIPTNIEGVYIYDDLAAEGQSITGQNKQTARELYAAYLAGYENNTQKNTVVTPKNGKIVIVGLKKGTYYYKETVPPAGYNAVSGIEAIEITDAKTSNIFNIYANEAGKVENIQASNNEYKEKQYSVDVATVRNSKGVVLPTTGGEGTFWLIAIGTAMVICFAVFLITHKKMSVYTD